MSDKKENDNDFSLYTEKIVVKPSVKYKKLIRFGEILLAAIVFGVVASLVMAVVYPYLSDKFEDNSSKETLVITKDEYPVEDGEDTENQDQETTTSVDASTDYKVMAKMLQSMSEEIQSSILSLDIYKTSVGDFVSETRSATETVGLVVGDVNNEYVILTDYTTIADCETVVVKFNSYIEVSATVIGSDDTTELGVITIKQSDIPANIRSSISVAELDNSYNVEQGDTVIACGKLYGNVKSVDYGTVTNLSTVSGVDNSYTLLNTGIGYEEGDFGFLYNVDGNVIGISSKQSSDTFSAIGISNLKSIIEVITNGGQISYMGIKGQNVTSAISVAYGLPMGIYVTDVVIDSPAYQAGIQPGDVINQFDGNMVLTIQAFSEKLYQCSSGQDIDITVKRYGKDVYNEMTFKVTVSLR